LERFASQYESSLGEQEHAMKKNLVGAAAAALMSVATLLAPSADAAPIGNYNLIIPDRADFHTWIWSVTACLNGVVSQPDCVFITAIPQPVAKAYNYQNQAHLAGGHYSLTVDDPFGLRCGNIYYGSTSPTHDVYVWDAATMAGTLTSSFDAGCDGAPGTLTYPFSLTRL
jgi:hypothetical protein